LGLLIFHLGSVQKNGSHIEDAGFSLEHFFYERLFFDYFEGFDGFSSRWCKHRIQEAGKLGFVALLSHGLVEQEVVEQVEPS